MVGLEGPELVISDVVVLGASEDLAPGSRRMERRDLCLLCLGITGNQACAALAPRVSQAPGFFPLFLIVYKSIRAFIIQ